jgi:phosphinothricin acetyltransferase
MAKLPVHLEPLSWSDVERVFAWQCTPELRRYYRHTAAPTWAEHEAYWQKNLADETNHQYVIIFRGQPVGVCGLKVDSGDNSAEVEIYVAELAARGQGVGTEALALLIRLGFERLGLRFVWLTVATDNIVALRLYRQAGFVEAPGQEMESSDSGHPLLHLACYNVCR